MSYSRWGSRGSGHWYTYWRTSPKETKETKDNAIFEICDVHSFTAKELRDNIERCINIVSNKDKTLDQNNLKISKKDMLDELKVYMNEFLEDIRNEFRKKN